MTYLQHEQWCKTRDLSRSVMNFYAEKNKCTHLRRSTTFFTPFLRGFKGQNEQVVGTQIQDQQGINFERALENNKIALHIAENLRDIVSPDVSLQKHDQRALAIDLQNILSHRHY